MSPNDADGMANSVDPDQTVSSLIWVCNVYPGLSIQKLRIIMVIYVIFLNFEQKLLKSDKHFNREDLDQTGA